ncbi:MAG: tRNA pseudouridine(38-40) synthase TruA [Anaerococcus sp.]|nr:tRNA pseudouridine(38-40) synthase TruA [Anaerococcus sp.]
MIKNVLLEIAYDGSGFAGFQYQKDQRSVEEELLKALRKLTGEDIRIVACGRTDAGVHAKSHFVNFLTASHISPKAYNFHINKYLPDDILALSSNKVDLDFHARFSCRGKLYRYVINRDTNMHPIFRKYKENITYKMDLDKLDLGLKLLEGVHDFSSFMAEDKNVRVNPIRKIDKAYFEEEGSDLAIYFYGQSFLHNQVRLMVGSLVELARGRLSLDDFKNFLDKNSRKKANPALGPGGLYLWRVDF